MFSSALYTLTPVCEDFTESRLNPAIRPPKILNNFTFFTGKNMARKSTKFNFEDALENLEKLVEAMEEGELSLEESLKAFEQGIKLTRECQTALEKAEQKVQLLVSSDDMPESEPFEDDGEEDTE